MAGLRGEDFWLSNSYPATVEVAGYFYPTNWHAWAGLWAATDSERYLARTAPSPAVAAALGQRYSRAAGAEDVKLILEMYDLVLQKFQLHSELGYRLVATGARVLSSEEPTGDTFWGRHNGKGRDLLGRTLMDVRSELRRYLAPRRPA